MSYVKKSNNRTADEVLKTGQDAVHSEWYKFWGQTKRSPKLLKTHFMIIVTYKGHQNWSETFSEHFKVFDDHHMGCQTWNHYVWTSLSQALFGNLIHNPTVPLSDISHLLVSEYVQWIYQWMFSLNKFMYFQWEMDGNCFTECSYFYLCVALTTTSGGKFLCKWQQG